MLPEIGSEGNGYDFGARIYDARIARWLSLDPLQKKYPGESHYSFTSNSPLLYKDADGLDKIVTVTFILKDGGHMQIQMIDKTYFEYDKYNRYQKLPQPYKTDLEINLTIDFSKASDNQLPNISISSKRSNRRDISTYEYSVVSDWVNTAKDFLGVGTENQKTKYGFRILGNSTNTDWNEGLPKAADGSGTLNLKAFLDLAGGLKGENAQYQEKILKMFSVMLLGDKVEKVGKLERVAHIAENTAKAVEILANIITSNESSNTSNGNNKSLPIRIDLERTIYNKYGNKENQPWTSGRGMQIGETKDSVSATGDTLYKIKTAWKEK